MKIKITGKFNQLVYNYPIRIPEIFSLVIRSLLTQEGICFTLKPDFKFLEVWHVPPSQFLRKQHCTLFNLLQSYSVCLFIFRSHIHM
jgi:predicted unusual protein kinase regulating ubiquinone biosynthesis (AarF/ABC1/UbiB family)